VAPRCNPDEPKQIVAREGVMRVTDQQTQQLYLLLRERHEQAVALDAQRIEVHVDLREAYLGGRRAITGRTTQHRREAREELTDGERFRDVVIGSDLKAAGLSASLERAVRMMMGARARPARSRCALPAH
jgi:hypothetical protein